MSWFNYIGLAVMVLIMIPNIVYSIKIKEKPNSKIKKWIEVLEQIGRYGCMVLMVFNIPYTYYNFFFEHAHIVYLIVNAVLVYFYLVIWIAYNKTSKIFKGYALSIIPTLIFIFSGIMLLSIPLICFSILFGITHIYISLKNAYNA